MNANDRKVWKKSALIAGGIFIIFGVFISYYGNPDTSSSASISTIEDVLADTHIKGDKNTTFTIVEFSDPGCGYCQRQYTDKTHQQVVDHFDGDVNIVMKFHAHYKPDISRGIICAGIMEGDEKYHDFIDLAFTQQGLTTDAIAKRIDLDEQEFRECMRGEEVKNILKRNSSEADKYNLSGTPNHLIINNKTGKFTRVAGAAPASTFIGAIEKITD